MLPSTGLAGAAIPAGALLSWCEDITEGHLRQDLLHGVIAFGGGALLAAVAALFLFAGGGILYLVSHDIAPMALRGGHSTPTLGAVVGFLAGMVGHALV